MRYIIFLLVFLGSLAAASGSGNCSVSGLLGSYLRYQIDVQWLHENFTVRTATFFLSLTVEILFYQCKLLSGVLGATQFWRQLASKWSHSLHHTGKRATKLCYETKLIVGRFKHQSTYYICKLFLRFSWLKWFLFLSYIRLLQIAGIDSEKTLWSFPRLRWWSAVDDWEMCSSREMLQKLDWVSLNTLGIAWVLIRC